MKPYLKLLLICSYSLEEVLEIIGGIYSFVKRGLLNVDPSPALSWYVAPAQTHSFNGFT